MSDLDPNSDEYAMQYGLEPDHPADGELHCPNDDCDWWVPEGMGYTFLAHREQTGHGVDDDEFLRTPAEAVAEIEATREFALDNSGDMVSRAEFYDRLREAGATVDENPDDENRPDNVERPADVAFRDVPDGPSLRAAMLAIDTGRDPAEFISPLPAADASSGEYTDESDN